MISSDGALSVPSPSFRLILIYFNITQRCCCHVVFLVIKVLRYLKSDPLDIFDTVTNSCYLHHFASICANHHFFGLRSVDPAGFHPVPHFIEYRCGTYWKKQNSKKTTVPMSEENTYFEIPSYDGFPMLSGPPVLSHFTEANAEVRWRPFSSLLLWEFPRAWHQCNYFGTFGRTIENDGDTLGRKQKWINMKQTMDLNGIIMNN